MNPSRYFDHHATAPLLPAARDALEKQLEMVGNGSSVHGFGRAKRRVLDEARRSFADFFATSSRRVIFTSSATEANNLALQGVCASHLIVSAVEHDSVWKVAQAREAAVVGVTADGLLCETSLRRAMAACQGKRFLVSLMAANNETGVMWNIPSLASSIHDAGGWLHCDGVQSLGRVASRWYEGADMISVSSHKIGGAMGAGALIVLSDDAALLEGMRPVIHGGGQEHGLRAGTENVAAIASFAAALVHCPEAWRQQSQLESLRNYFEKQLHNIFATRLTVWGAQSPRLAGVSCFSIEGWRSIEMVMALDLEGIAVSSGSACSSGQIQPSRVISAMGGTKKQASELLRVSFGAEHTKKDVDYVLKTMKRIAPPLALKHSFAL